MNIPWRVHNLRNSLEHFLDSRQLMSAIDTRNIVESLKTEAKDIYIKAHIESKGDVKKSFIDCYDEMLEIQHHLLMY